MNNSITAPVSSLKRIFVTSPAFRTGIPATLSEVKREKNAEGEALLSPFPNWEEQNTCEGLTSVYRIYVSIHDILSIQLSKYLSVKFIYKKLKIPKLIEMSGNEHKKNTSAK